ncbi:MAG: hypothetical protein ASARMPRED_002166 [Alectoria sarmentosa]|nr:MAG: hypothetical protein ASARMPRED_002166 [Alectoria sarmentosa]
MIRSRWDPPEQMGDGKRSEQPEGHTVMPEAREQLSGATGSTPYLQQLARLASPVPNFAATLTTQAEQDAEDANVSFLRTEVPDIQASRLRDDAGESRRRMRRAVDAMAEPRIYTPAQLEELGSLSTYSDRMSQQVYHGWAPGTSDDEQENRHEGPFVSRSSAALLDEHVLRRDEHLRERMRLRRLRDATQLEWRDHVPSESVTQIPSPQQRTYSVENEPGGIPTVTESSLRTTALLQAVRRNPQFSARLGNELQRYILDRERGDERDRTSSARSNEPSNSNLSQSQRRQLHREATVRQEIQQHQNLIAENQQRRQLEEQLRQQRHNLAQPSENRRRRYWHTPSPCPPSEKRPVDEAIKYLERLRSCESDQEGLESAEEAGLGPEECFPKDLRDFLSNIRIIPPPPESSWLKIGAILSGTQHGASPSSLPSYTPLMPPSTYRARARNPHFGSHPPRDISPVRHAPYFATSASEPSSTLVEERWDVKVTVDSIDYSTMTLSGTMEAFDVPDKNSPTKVSSITTYLEGEIIDFNNFTLETKSFKADARVDGMYWRKLPPFKDLDDDEAMARNLLSQEWLRKELMEKWILMRWKEKCFVTPSNPDTALTISGWDTTYTHDLTTHASTPSHTGQTWFEDVNASRKILNYLTSPSSKLPLDKKATTFLDLGTGNGEMLFLLREEGGFGGRMVGVDYSAGSVELCRRLAIAKGIPLISEETGEGEKEGTVEFTEWDILRSTPPPSWTNSGFDVVFDKGTFDAISLSAETDERGKRVCEGYRARVERLVKKGGVVVVTSCNWTEEELVGWFEGGGGDGDGEGGLEVCGRVVYPVFRFGGVEGQSVQSVVFRKRG